MNFLLKADQSFLLMINQGMANGALDGIMRAISSNTLWSGLGIALVIFSIATRRPALVRLVLLLTCALAVTDSLSYFVLKPEFGRIRPCRELAGMVRWVGTCAGMYGFPSNHAANSMAVVGVLWGRHYFRSATAMLWAALLVGLSRIYLGVHYPADVIFGFAVGGAISIAVVLVASKWLPQRDEPKSIKRLGA